MKIHLDKISDIANLDINTPYSLNGLWALIQHLDKEYNPPSRHSHENMMGVMETFLRETRSIIGNGKPPENYGPLPARVLSNVVDVVNGNSNAMRAMHAVDRGLFMPEGIDPINLIPETFLRRIIQEEVPTGADIRTIMTYDMLKKIIPSKMLNDLTTPTPYLNGLTQIGFNATCSAPFIVLSYLLIEDTFPEARIFEAGAGCGYHLACTANLKEGFRVYSGEIVPELEEMCRMNLNKLPNAEEISKRVVVGSADCNEPDSEFFLANAPYDIIHFTFLYPCGEGRIDRFMDYLNNGGVLIVPLANKNQSHPGSGKLIAVHKTEPEPCVYSFGDISFTPAIEKMD